MNTSKLAYLIPAGLLVFATACGPKADTIEKKSESTTETSEGTVKTTSESTQVGTTLAATSETKVDTASGTVSSKTETIIGTVTVFEAGKKLEVMTGEKKMHSCPRQQGHRLLHRRRPGGGQARHGGRTDR